jgi:hypothetical protein
MLFIASADADHQRFFRAMEYSIFRATLLCLSKKIQTLQQNC